LIRALFFWILAYKPGLVAILFRHF
jgi:hypothetical protein